MSAAAAPIETDAVVVGAGPVGLFQVFQLGLLEMSAHVVDSLPYPGGQCVELYADKPIYDIPALKVCTGQELTERLLAQIEPFHPTLHYGDVVSSLQRQPDDRFLLSTAKGRQFLCKVVAIAAGVGAFLPRKLKVDGIEAFEGSQVFHALPDASQLAARHVIVAGDEDNALQAAIDLCKPGPQQPASVALMHRRDGFRAAPGTIAAMRALVDSGRLRLVIGQPTGFGAPQGKLTHLQVLGADGQARDEPADAVVALLGISPKLGPVAEWGLDMERKQLQVDTEAFATSERGIFAVGDVNTYPGKKKLILCGFHECVLAAFGAAAIVYPGQKIQLQYTTTSTRLHELLGVSPA